MNEGPLGFSVVIAGAKEAKWTSDTAKEYSCLIFNSWHGACHTSSYVRPRYARMRARILRLGVTVASEPERGSVPVLFRGKF